MAALRFHPDALEELDAAVELLERERPGHGRLLFAEVRRRVTQASLLPRSGAPIRGADARAYRLRRFRYSLVVAVVDGTAIVIALAHQSRQPGYWKARIP